jgi:hypothetical protein
MSLLPDAGIETIEDKLKTVLKLRSATVNDIPVLMHMARALAEQQGLAPLMTATAAGWRRDLGQAFDATVAAIKNKPVGMALTVCMQAFAFLNRCAAQVPSVKLKQVKRA